MTELERKLLECVQLILNKDAPLSPRRVFKAETHYFFDGKKTYIVVYHDSNGDIQMFERKEQINYAIPEIRCPK